MTQIRRNADEQLVWIMSTIRIFSLVHNFLNLFIKNRVPTGDAQGSVFHELPTGAFTYPGRQQLGGPLETILCKSTKLWKFRILIFYSENSILPQFTSFYIHMEPCQGHMDCVLYASVLKAQGWLSTSNWPFLHVLLPLCPGRACQHHRTTTLTSPFGAHVSTEGTVSS